MTDDIVERLESPLSGINRQWVLEGATEIKRLTLLHEISERQAELEIKRLQRRITTLEGMLGEMNVAVPE